MSSSAVPRGRTRAHTSGRQARHRAPLACVLLLALHAGCEGAKASKPGPRVVPVTAQLATRADVPLEIDANGNVVPISTIAVKSRVDGQIERVFFREGDDIAKGHPLFLIDPRPFRLALEQAQANLARDQVQEHNAELQEHRAAELLKQNLVSQQEYDQSYTQLASLRATLQADRGALDTAKVNLGYTKILAPIDGRTGSLQITAGNLIKANADTPLVVIRQISPIYVSFAVPADKLPQIRKNQAQAQLAVEARVPPDPTTAKGTLTFIDNTVDTATGTIALKATFANHDHALWPGQFVEVKMRLATLHDVVVVPARAVTTGQRGDQVFVLDDKLVAHARRVGSGLRAGDTVVIDRGLKAGERIVTDGQLNLVEGTKVELKPGLGSAEAAEAPP